MLRQQARVEIGFVRRDAGVAQAMPRRAYAVVDRAKGPPSSRLSAFPTGST
jgi:hypothetical protein